MSDRPKTLLEELRESENKLRGIRAKNGEGNIGAAFAINRRRAGDKPPPPLKPGQKPRASAKDTFTR